MSLLNALVTGSSIAPQGQDYDMIRFICMSSKPILARKSNTPKLEPKEFCRACGKFATGVTIATVTGQDGTPHGMTANSFASVSLTPPMVLICVDHRTKILNDFLRSEHFAINVLSEDQEHLSRHFARSGHDRFDGVKWYAGETGAPLLPGVLASVECALVKAVVAGDHSILIGEVLHAAYRDGRPLVYFGSGYQRLAAHLPGSSNSSTIG